MTKRTPFSLTLADCLLEFERFTSDVPRFTIPAGTVTALLGPSGSGKSTILNCMGMLEHVGKYRVLIDGEDVSPKQVHGRVTAVFQRPYLMKGSIKDNIVYGLTLRHAERSLKRRQAESMLELVGLTGRGKESVKGLSGGEAQRVALARALAVEPAALLLDEPLASLDTSLKRHIAREFARILSDSDTTALYITHDVDEALIVADNIAIVIDGRIAVYGPIREVISIVINPDVAEFLGVDLAFPATVTAIRDGLAELASPFGPVFSRADGRQIHDELFCAIKPEDVKVHEVGKVSESIRDGRNRVRGTLTKVRALGMTQQLVFTVGESTISSLISLALHDERGFRVGGEYVLSFSPMSVQALPADRTLAHSIVE